MEGIETQVLFMKENFRTKKSFTKKIQRLKIPGAWNSITENFGKSNFGINQSLFLCVFKKTQGQSKKTQGPFCTKNSTHRRLIQILPKNFKTLQITITVFIGVTSSRSFLLTKIKCNFYWFSAPFTVIFGRKLWFLKITQGCGQNNSRNWQKTQPFGGKSLN